MPKPKVLIVEDNFSTYEELAALFEELDFNVIRDAPNKAVDNYADAVKLLQQHTPNLAVLDISLKGGEYDGLDLGRYIKKRFNIVVFLFTGHATPANHNRASQMKHEGFLLKGKPLDIPQVRSAVLSRMPEILKPAPPETPGASLNVRKWPDASGNEAYPEDLDEHIRYLFWKDLWCLKTYGPEKTAVKNNVFLYTAPGAVYLHYSSLDGMAAIVPPHYFARVNQAAIINLYYVNRHNIRTDKLQVHAEWFEISPRYKEEVLQKIKAFLGER